MNWRLILDGAATGAWNMAVDEALLLEQGRGEAPPTLRFYDWQPACISLGRFQKSFVPPPSSFDLVRRPTGGRAVLHQHEITYSVVVGEALLPFDARSVVGAYRWLSSGLVSGLQQLGIAAALARQIETSETTPKMESQRANCFSSVALCDFLVGSKKLIGAAQCRKGGAILQHGSLLLDIDETAWGALLGGSMNATVSLRALGLTASRQDVVKALCVGLERALNVTLVQGVPSDEEATMARQLHDCKYTQPAWNLEAVENLTVGIP